MLLVLFESTANGKTGQRAKEPENFEKNQTTFFGPGCPTLSNPFVIKTSFRLNAVSEKAPRKFTALSSFLIESPYGVCMLPINRASKHYESTFKKDHLELAENLCFDGL